MSSAAALAHVLTRWPELADRLTARGIDGKPGLSVLTAEAIVERNGHSPDASWIDCLVRFRLLLERPAPEDGVRPLRELREFLRLHPDAGSLSERLF